MTPSNPLRARTGPARLRKPGRVSSPPALPAGHFLRLRSAEGVKQSHQRPDADETWWLWLIVLLIVVFIHLGGHIATGLGAASVAP